MLAPSRAQRSAIERPMPRLAPVMKTVLLLRSAKKHPFQHEGREGKRK
jgi:hypothetical protein